MDLDALGISARDERVYRYLLRRPDGVNRAEAATDLGLCAADLVAVVDALAELGLISGHEVLHARDPERALDDLIERRIAETRERMREIGAVRDVLPSLLRERATGEPVELIERVEDIDRVYARIAEVREASDECLAIASAERRHVQPGQQQRTLDRLRRGKIYRTIVHRDALASPAMRAHMTVIHRAGDHHRVVNEQVQPTLIFDRAVAFVPLDPGNPANGALVVRQPGVVATLLDLFERLWDRATDLEPAGDGLNEAERLVLDLLSRSSKDETAARELGVSVRTYRKHVASLMERLGASTRFQAARLAGERGWL
ncbi:hypothetical protein Afil01_09760 [Actinorhabdospora filicis]|uniref:HTH luxR-type domain-containing protein n=1 Tax=Actinorhabdospora filicis TaxID=1785913 RepID=A0A9W6SFF0_9ACTN|nr:helix-turn-helix transcriptional regulator [Actinorhabdospora filicis]GLZ76169.1 hypothetical protein Afil01_09760 [Actinorhabdospora filicis]